MRPRRGLGPAVRLDVPLSACREGAGRGRDGAWSATRAGSSMAARLRRTSASPSVADTPVSLGPRRDPPFWVPEFRQKQDAVPGITTQITITPTKTGSYRLICTELCGLGHALMRTWAIVTSRPTWNAGYRRAPPRGHELTTVHDQTEEHEAPAAPRPRRTGLWRLLAPGWLRAIWMTALFGALGVGLVVGLRARRVASDHRLGADHHGGVPHCGATRVPRRSRGRLLAPLGLRISDAARRTTRVTAPSAGPTTSGSTPTTR